MIRTPILLLALGGSLGLAAAAVAQTPPSGGGAAQPAPAGATARVGARGSPSTVSPGSAEPEGAASALVGADRPYQDPTLPATAPSAATAAGAARDASATVPNPSATAPAAKGKKTGATSPATQPGADPQPR